jgi:xanthine dehydrogenase YagS FAD-binding subunit
MTRLHAILGASAHCIATHPSDMAVAMLALDAKVEILGANGPRTIALDDLYLLPGDTPHVETALEPGDLITAVELPPAPSGRQSYRKIRDRASYAFALVSIASVIRVEGGVIREARLAFGGIAPRPWRNLRVEEGLAGQRPSPRLFEEAADRLLADAKGQGDNDFKIPLTRRLLASVLRDAAAGDGP